MESEGLVKRITDEIDLRQSRVYITEKGRQINEKLRSNLVRSEEAVLESISAEEEQLLRTLLLKMRSNLIEKPKEDDK